MFPQIPNRKILMVCEEKAKCTMNQDDNEFNFFSHLAESEILLANAFFAVVKSSRVNMCNFVITFCAVRENGATIRACLEDRHIDIR